LWLEKVMQLARPLAQAQQIGSIKLTLKKGAPTLVFNGVVPSARKEI